MDVILHRVNTKNALIKIPVNYGVEVDIRTKGNRLILQHEPFKNGEDFEEWLKFYRHKFIILNVKEEGLEGYVTNLMEKFKIENYFFLDQSFPFLIKISDSNTRCSVRISEFESIYTAISLSGKIDWVWIDCFSKFPLTKEQVQSLRIDFGFKLCFVSPELQGRMSVMHVKKFIQELRSLDIHGDAVCTKFPELWN